MGFQELSPKLSYRSNRDDLMNDFYIPVLSNSVTYYRGAGFFSVHLLNKLGKGLYSFIKNGGKMKLVTGIQLSQDTVNEINQGYVLRSQLLEDEIKKQIDIVIDSLISDYLTTELSNICWMIAHESLELKVAIRINDNKISPGIYHEKIAVFIDEEDNKIGTIGSINETQNAYFDNFESFDVFKSWASEESRQRIDEKMSDFGLLWDNKTEGLLVCDFPYAQKERLIKLSPNDPQSDINRYIRDQDIKEEESPYEKKPTPHDYQQEAIRLWCENSYTGILEMATGTGKTYTSLFCVDTYLSKKQEQSYVTVVCCPYQHLVDQWEKSASNVFNDCPIIKCYISTRLWRAALTDILQKIVLGHLKHAIIITTTDTGSSPEFIKLLNSPKLNKIVICDEVHNIGSGVSRRFLDITAQAKLGLSATPIRPFDEEGNKAISSYFGKTVYKLGLEKAIQMGFLVRYFYYVTFCELDEAEYEVYKDLSIKIAQLYSKKTKTHNQDRLNWLLIKRAEIISTCSNKLEVFKDILDKINDKKNMLVYTAEDPIFFSETLEILNEKKVKTLKITADIENSKRKEITNMLRDQDIDCILAMRCLDEGVDIPAADKAVILASSINEKQYIQRRGRVLRTDPDGKKKYAHIYDILVIPPDFVNEIDSNLFGRELRRVLEFALISENGFQLIDQLQEFCRANKLMKNFVEVFYERSKGDNEL